MCHPTVVERKKHNSLTSECGRQTVYSDTSTPHAKLKVLKKTNHKPLYT